ncbi:MAG: carbon-nitrogen hydrolase family protein [Bryobacteraceae bacterium]|nr:carbon-nitrogen hydrolase family protein [Bryobacteraceae bacterium]
MEARFRLAMGQMLVAPGEPDRNMTRAVEMIRRSAEEGCRVVVLPECLDLGWTDPSAGWAALPIPGARSQELAEAARAGGVYVVAGLTERDGDQAYNAAVLLSPKGELLLRHRKINELDIATSIYATGTDLAVRRTELGTIGVTICADNFPDSLALAHSAARMGAQMLLSPCAWAVDADHDNARDPYGQLWLDAYVPLAKYCDMTVAGVSNVGWIGGGPWQGRKCIGCSLAVAPGGEVIARGPYGEAAEELIVVEVAPREAIGRGTGFSDALRARGARL